MGFRTDQDRTACTRLDQHDASENERPHDPVPQFGFGDHQGPQVFGRNEQRLHIVDGMNVDQRRPAGQLPHLGDEVAGSQFDDGGQTSQWIAPGYPDRTGNENEHARSNVARDEKRLACSVMSDLAEAAQAAQSHRDRISETSARREDQWMAWEALLLNSVR